MSALCIAVGLSAVSALGYAGGAVAQRHLAAQLDATVPHRPLSRLLTRRLWWISVALNSTGAILHAVALAYGTLIVVQPLGTLTLVIALPWSAWLAARRVSPRQWHGALLTVLALSVLVVTAGAGTAGHTLTDTRVLALSATAGAVVAALAGASTATHTAVTRSLLLAAAAGVSFGAASALAKTVLDAVAAAGPWGALSLAATATALLAGAGLLLSQAAYSRMDVGAPLATMTLANPLASVCAGLLFIGETYAGGPWGAGVALLSAIVAARGVVLLCVPAPPEAPRPTRRLLHTSHR
ncbi:DMT family transporter [Nocardiopsis ansamitocini]|uniref:Magnesium transporter NIPA n=1 Tax=Nocardiopsis ansamitocini TaxID=1670832 RepID=A0A9W6P6Y9_9ACTN|nr:DMT family transporter [Nocardiopsis ansamitocini]GLU48207.1 hypothetical protein Nans01_25580 [Nocardiopsis ansamitocini]